MITDHLRLLTSQLKDLDSPEVQEALRKAKRVSDRFFGWMPQSKGGKKPTDHPPNDEHTPSDP